MGILKLTAEEIAAGASPKGGYTKARLQEWGVPYPPPSGWKDYLIAGMEVPPRVERPLTDDDLLRMVVLAVVEAGHASDLYDLPEVLDRFGARSPTDKELAEAGVIRSRG